MTTCTLCGLRFSITRCPRCGTPAAASPDAAPPTPGTPAPPAQAPLAAVPTDRGAMNGLLGTSIEGVVRQAHGPSPGPPRQNPWKAATLILAGVGLLPVLLVLLVLRLAFHVAFLILFRASLARGGRSLGGDLFSAALVRLFQPSAEPVQVYAYVIECGGGLLNARQEGDFLDGRIYAGHRVRLRGPSRGGTLLVRSGENLTLGTRLTLPRNPWTAAFFACAGLLSLLYYALVAAGGR